MAADGWVVEKLWRRRTLTRIEIRRREQRRCARGIEREDSRVVNTTLSKRLAQEEGDCLRDVGRIRLSSIRDHASVHACPERLRRHLELVLEDVRPHARCIVSLVDGPGDARPQNSPVPEVELIRPVVRDRSPGSATDQRPLFVLAELVVGLARGGRMLLTHRRA